MAGKGLKPQRGTPEYELWIAAIDIAIYPPARNSHSAGVYAAKVPWRQIEALRVALDGVGIDWQTAKDREDQRLALIRRPDGSR